VVQVKVIPEDPGAPQYQTFFYDVLGNLTEKDTDRGNGLEPVQYRIDPLTNQIQGFVGSNTDWIYSPNGALTNDTILQYDYDNAGRLKLVKTPTNNLEVGSYKYDAGGARIYRKENHGKEEFTFRDTRGAVLSKFSRPVGSGLTPQWDRDFVYMNGGLVAMIEETAPAPVSWQVTKSDSTGNTLEWWPNSGSGIYGYLVLRKGPGDNSFKGLFADGTSAITTSGCSYLDIGGDLPEGT